MVIMLVNASCELVLKDLAMAVVELPDITGVQARTPISLPLQLKQVPLYLILHRLYHIVGLQSSFTHVFNFIVLADDSRTPMQGIDTASATLTLLLVFVFYLPNFHFNLLSFSKITKVLNYKWHFFLRIMYFRSLRQGRRLAQDVSGTDSMC